MDPAPPILSAKLPSPAEMARFDQLTIDAGTPSIELMERAGAAVYEELLAICDAHPERLENALVLCGPGNNGGDGLVIAQQLHKSGRNPTVVMVSSKGYSADCRIQLQKAAWQGVPILLFGDEVSALEGIAFERCTSDQLAELLQNCALVLDALLGTGAKDAPRGIMRDLMEIAEECLQNIAPQPVVVAVDIPSGINADSGAVYSPALRAHYTVTIELLKRGMLQYPAREFCGDISVCSIELDTREHTEFLLNKPELLALSFKRQGDFHKGMAGHVLVIGGSHNYPGAPLLAGTAALRSGAGLVTVAALGGVHYPQAAPELMYYFAGSAQDRYFKDAHVSALKSEVEEADVIILGPGLGTQPATRAFFAKLLKLLAKLEKPLVLDADGLNLLASMPKKPALKHAVLTPHPGEAGKLLRRSAPQIQADRYGAARKLSDLTRSIIVLKGAGSIVYIDNYGFVNTSGNPFMATAGSGDVLSGMIAALIAQSGGSRDEILNATKAAVYLHGRAGDLAYSARHAPIIAGDIIASIPEAISTL